MFMRDFAKDCNVEDTAIAVIWFQSGAVASVTCSWKVPGELANPFRIVGTRGSLVLHGKEIHVRGHDGQCKVMSLGGHSDKPTITDLFVRWITHGAPFPATGREAMETIKVLEAACRTMDAAWRLPASHKSSA